MKRIRLSQLVRLRKAQGLLHPSETLIKVWAKENFCNINLSGALIITAPETGNKHRKNYYIYEDKFTEWVKSNKDTIGERQLAIGLDLPFIKEEKPLEEKKEVQTTLLDAPQASNSAYYRSAYWEKVRREVLERENYLCQCCRVNQAVKILRLYPNQDKEFMFACYATCPSCHDEWHKKYGSRKQLYNYFIQNGEQSTS